MVAAIRAAGVSQPVGFFHEWYDLRADSGMRDSDASLAPGVYRLAR